MGLFLFNELKNKPKELKEVQLLLQTVEGLNVIIAEIVAFSQAVHTPEIGLEQSIKDSIFLLDSTQDYRGSEYHIASSSFHGRAVAGRLQRLDALEEKLNAALASIQGES